MCKEYMKMCRPREGIDSIPGGAEFYQQCLKWHTSLDITPDRIHEIGLAEVARIRKEMERVKFVCIVHCVCVRVCCAYVYCFFTLYFLIFCIYCE